MITERKQKNISKWFRISRFIVVFGLTFTTVCKTKQPVTNSEPLPSQIVTDFKMYESASGKRMYYLYAEKAFVFEEPQKINVIKPYVIFYKENGAVNSTLKSISGWVNSKTSDLFAKDSVIVQTSDSTILRTDSLVWDNDDQIITTDAWVKIDSKQGLIEGQGLTSDAGLKKIEIKSSVTGKSHYEF